MTAADAPLTAFFQATPLRRKTYRRIRQVFDEAADYSRSRFEQFTRRFAAPLAGDLERALRFPKLDNMSRDGAASRILAAAAVDLEPDKELLLELGYIMQLGNAHMLLIDEVIDNKFDGDPGRADLLPVADTFYLEFIIEMQRLVGHDPGLNARLRDLYQDAYQAIAWEEHRHVARLSGYGPEDFVKIQQKCAPLKLVFYPILRARGRLDMESAIGRVIDEFVLSCLLLDDFNDWREDLHNRRYTWPLTLGLARLGINETAVIPPLSETFLQRLERAMCASEVPLQVYRRSLAALETARAGAESVLPTTALLLGERLTELRRGVRRLIQAQNLMLDSAA